MDINENSEMQYKCEYKIQKLDKIISKIHWCVIWICIFTILLSTSKGQSSATPLLYSETNEITNYGNEIFDTILNYRKTDGNIIDKLKSVANKTKINNIMNRIQPNILEKYSCKRERGLDNVNSMLQYFDLKYSEFEQYCSNTNNDDLCNKFITQMIVVHDSGLIDEYIDEGSQWDMINDPFGNYELFKTLIDLHNPMVENNCSSVQSLNQYIYDLYNTILYAYIRIYSIILYTYMNSPIKDNSPVLDNNCPSCEFLMKYHLGNGSQEAIKHFAMHTRKLAENVLEVIEHASRNILSYDPSTHVKGVTYDSLDYFIQDYVTDEMFLKQDKKCTSTCSDYKNTIYYNHIEGKYFPRNLICTGRIRSCTDSEVEKIYLASSDSTRRYEGLSNIPFNNKSLKYWGHNGEHSDIISIALYSQLCSRICLCTCDMIDSPKSIRYIDLRISRSQSYSSFVITGVRFRIINRVLCLQIQEGELRNGKVIPDTVAWVEIDDINTDYNTDPMIFKLDYDYRSLDLSDLTLPRNYALTMVGFMVIDEIVGLRIEGHPIINGELNLDSDKQKLSVQSAKTLSSRPVFHQDGTDLPIGNTIKNFKLSEPNKFLLKFETSDWDKDAGQNVVPFIDLQNVVTDPPTPVSGFGVYVRYGGNSGGFLAPKVISDENSMKLLQSAIFQEYKKLKSSFEDNKSENGAMHNFLHFG